MKAPFIYLFIGWTFTPLLKFVDKYVFNDWEFVKFLVIICIVDTLLGVYKSFKLHEFSSKGFGMVFKKTIVYSCALVSTHVLVHFTIANKVYYVFSWLDYVVFSAIMVREIISIFENIAVIDPNAFPKSLLKRLKHFDTLTGEFKLKEQLEEAEEIRNEIDKAKTQSIEK